MKRLIDEAGAEGKTVESVTENDRFLVILFTDGTALLGRSAVCYDGCSDITVVTELTNLHDLLDCGLITQEEHDARRAENRRKSEEAQENRERKRYEELKQKFGE